MTALVAPLAALCASEDEYLLGWEGGQQCEICRLRGVPSFVPRERERIDGICTLEDNGQLGGAPIAFVISVQTKLDVSRIDGKMSVSELAER